jgi:hypothetical protein
MRGDKHPRDAVWKRKEAPGGAAGAQAGPVLAAEVERLCANFPAAHEI